MIHQGARKHPVREACLHTAATPGGWHEDKTDEEILEAFWGWHVRDNGWRKIGYHRIVTPDGRVLHDNGNRLRSIYEVGAGVRGRNRGVIHICMIPVRTHNGITRFEDYFTEEQRQAVKGYLSQLSDITDLRRVTGHNDFDNKECPGFRVHTNEWLDRSS